MLFRSGYVAILGRPNVGKSSFLNAVIGQKVAIVTPKPQTTRRRILGIYNAQGGQILFLDSPGAHRPPRKRLNQEMVRRAFAVAEEADLILYMVEPFPTLHPEDLEAWERIGRLCKKRWLVVNKIDRIGGSELAQVLDAFQTSLSPEEIFPISVLKKERLDHLLEEILSALPEGPRIYDEDEVTDQTERQLVAEMIREAAIGALRQELPYSLAVTIDSFKDEGRLSRVLATIHVERSSQKAIVIGAGGQMLKKIGTEARAEIERQLGRRFFLKLFVRVTENWTDDPSRLKELL